VGDLGHCPEEEPAAVLEVQWRQPALLDIVLEANRIANLAVLDDLQIADRLAGGQREADLQFQVATLLATERVAGQFVLDAGTQQRAIGDDDLSSLQILPP